MKGNRLKTLGFALLGGLALLFAGCGQQAAPPQTPPPQTPTTVAVEGLYDYSTDTPVDLNNVSGNVIVRAKVALGSVVPDKVQFLLDDTVEYEVAFGVATQSVRPQQATYTFEWNLNTAALDANLAPKYLNGSRSVKVRLVKGNQTVATSTATNVRFNNTDFAVFKMSGKAINKGGNRYYGGGEVSVEVVPVLYSGKPIASVRLYMPTVDLDPSTPGVQDSKTLTAAPYVFTVPYTSANRNSPALNGATGTSNPYTYFTLTYSDTTSFPNIRWAVLDGQQVLVDNTGLLSNNPPFSFSNLRLDYYVAPVVGSAIACKGSSQFTIDGQFATSGNLKAGLSSYSTDDGVGGDRLVVDVKTTLAQTVLSDVEVAISGGGCSGAGALAGLTEGGFYRVVVKAVKDELGNTRDVSPALQTVAFGIDDTKPTIALKSGWDSRVYFNSSSLNTGSLSGADLEGNSISTPGAVTVLANVNDPAAGTPPVASGIASYSWTVNGQAISGHTLPDIPGLDTIAGTLGSAPQGYYTLTVRAVDNAGNVSDPLTLNVLYDNTAPNVLFTAPTVTALTGGSSFTATAKGTDNVDLRQGRIYWSYGTAYRLEAFRSPVKAFGTPATTSQDYSVALRAIKPATGPVNNFALFAWVEDQARNALATADLSTLTVTPANSNTAGSVTGITETPDISAGGGGSTTLTITHSGGTANVVAVRVYRLNPSITLGGYQYFDYLGDATSLGSNNYALVVTVPGGVAPANALLFVLVEYDNGLATGVTYNYDYNTFSPVF